MFFNWSMYFSVLYSRLDSLIHYTEIAYHRNINLPLNNRFLKVNLQKYHSMIEISESLMVGFSPWKLYANLPFLVFGRFYGSSFCGWRKQTVTKRMENFSICRRENMVGLQKSHCGVKLCVVKVRERIGTRGLQKREQNTDTVTALWCRQCVDSIAE